jgi:hypothetical protein
MKGQLMRNFFQRISSRKFLTAFAVQVASVTAIFYPQYESTIETTALRIAAFAALLLAALGYGKIEATVDANTKQS